ncbi:hypothetical protein BJ742DRAFT_826706 [Cladochytrium replicatum]|nr:hypothetical protein BJ742DRAFT_826706 [Cladochytrium replicatum]
MFRKNIEVFKFALYIMFPIGSMYIYNRPEVQDWFYPPEKPGPFDDFIIPESKLFKLPQSREELDEQVEKMKRNHLRSQQERK